MPSGLGYGSGLSSAAFTMLKMAVVAPMPSANVMIDAAENPGAYTRPLRTNLMSCHSVLIPNEDTAPSVSEVPENAEKAASGLAGAASAYDTYFVAVIRCDGRSR